MNPNNTTKDIEDRLFSMLSSQLKVPCEGLTRDATLESIGLDSLATIEFIFQVEDSFGIHFDEDGAPPKTLGEVFDQIAACMKKSPAHA